MKKKWSYLKYYPGQCFAFNDQDRIIGTVAPGGGFKAIGKRRIPPGERRV